jgi:putative ABC transport system permease protein
VNLFRSVQTALTNIVVNKLRSALTMLGIVIGVSAVILMVAILQGASSNVTKQFSKMGSNLILVVFSPTTDERRKISRRIDGLKMDDVRAIREKCSLVKAVSPELPMGQNGTARYAGRDTECSPSGVTPEYERMRNVKLASGRFISAEDSDTWAKVCVIGDKIRSELFEDADPMGRTIEVNGQTLTVVGVLQSKGRTFEGDADKTVFIPLSTVQKRLLGVELVGAIYAEPVSLDKMDGAKDQIWELLMARYDNLPGWKVDSFDNMLNSIKQVLFIFTLLLGGIAGLALLVGGIGIMNIMLVSVTERTREIGIRKAIGAKSRDILLQFLIESATLTGVGGIIGVTLGTGTAYLIGYITTFLPQLTDRQTGEKGMPMFVPPWIMIGAFAFSAAVGIFFGIYPAIRASRLHPIEALRHE